MHPNRTISLSAAVLACALLAACSTTRDPRRPAPADRSGTEAPAEREPETREPVTRTVQGFRIQILTTPEKDAADAYVEEALSWWRNLSPAERPPYLGEGSLDVDVKWKQPYYRVHLGAFATRAEAERALQVVSETFQEAFIVPETVTVTR